MAEPNQDLIIGIDLGTTFTCAGFFNENTHMVEVLQNNEGTYTTASVVTFQENRTLVGAAALKRCWEGSKDTVTDAKRFIGNKFSSKGV